MIQARKAPQPVIETRFMPEPEGEPTGNAFLDRMMTVMDTEQFSSEEIKEGFIALAAGLVEVEQQVAQYGQHFQGLVDAVQSVATRFDGVTVDMTRLVQAIRGIKMPEFKVPPAKDVDLSPIKSSIDDLRIMVAMMEKEAPEPQEKQPEEWVFDIKRNQSGLIKSVEVREI
jgi:hypothetical protein